MVRFGQLEMTEWNIHCKGMRCVYRRRRALSIIHLDDFKLFNTDEYKSEMNQGIVMARYNVNLCYP